MTRGWRLRGRRPAKSRQKRAGLRRCGGSVGRGRHGKEGVDKSFVVARSCRRRDGLEAFVRIGVQKKVMASFFRLFVGGAAPSGQTSRWMDVGDGRVWRRIRFQLEGPLLLNSGSVVFCLGVLGAGGYECWAGVGSTGHLGLEGGRVSNTQAAHPCRTNAPGSGNMSIFTCPDRRQLCLARQRLSFSFDELD